MKVTARGGVRTLAEIDLAYPFEGRWLTQNSPANRVPSHGTTLMATSYAIDFVPVDEAGRTAPITVGSLLRPAPQSGSPVSVAPSSRRSTAWSSG